MGPLILVVDDAMFMRRVIQSALSQGGYENVAEAADGDEAIKKYKERRPDLVLLDITMPGKTGIEVLGDILLQDRTAKVIMCSAVGQEQVISQAIRDGAYDFIIKPFRPETLIRLVEAALSDAKMQ